MCDSLAEGGMRCAAHTRPAFEDALAAVGGAATQPDLYNRMYREGWERSDAGQAMFEAAAEHASTPSGEKEVARFAEEHRKTGGKINKFALLLTRARHEGVQRREFRKEARSGYRKQKEKEKRAASRSMVELKVNPRIRPEDSHAAKYPEIAAMWCPERNHGVRPDQVAPKTNAGVWLICPEGHAFLGRLNNYANGWDRGMPPSCPQCDPRRREAFLRSQQKMALIAGEVDDPAAFDALTPVAQYRLLTRLGLVGAGTGMDRDLSMSIVRGELTLADVLAANDLGEVRGILLDVEATEEVGDLTDLDAASNLRGRGARDADRGLVAEVEAAMDGAALLGLAGSDDSLRETLLREQSEMLWAQACAHPEDVEVLLSTVESARGRSAGADELADRFGRELRATLDEPLPEGYRVERIASDGSVRTLQPTLAQRRFAMTVRERRRFMNFSGTGTGKTLATALAVQGSGARETLVVCPLPVVGQWREEFASGYGDEVEVRLGLPTGGEAPPAEGRSRVWVVNYDQFQGDPAQVEDRLAGLRGRVDAVVFDEVHRAKQSAPGVASKRRAALQKFIDDAGARNPRLMVIGASATPVVNNLEEAASLLRLVEGPNSKPFATAPTIGNAVTAHQRIAAAGHRNMPPPATALRTEEVVVDVTSSAAAVAARVQAIQRATGRKQVGAAMMERALLPEKLPAIEKAVRRAAGPSVVYTEYTTRMVDPIRDRLSRSGLRVATYTGDDSPEERAESLAAFGRGEIDVLIGSRPLTTGVDGLQRVSSNLVVASMPWTSADVDQLVGRVHRHGQVDDVTVTWVLTEAQVGEQKWSWCRDVRQRRVMFKRDLAAAAVDGVIPEGVLTGKPDAADSLAALKGIRGLYARSEATPA